MLMRVKIAMKANRREFKSEVASATMPERENKILKRDSAERKGKTAQQVECKCENVRLIPIINDNVKSDIVEKIEATLFFFYTYTRLLWNKLFI